ncbi:MAG TPA: transglycosylase SLT domain-containing protein, partial [Gemmatimonadales bacterium]|nr:transglycosylase SLT domain-containing protein [Gemmatimonadales bacterium]
LMAAQGYQESGLNQEARSPVGAIGVMQIMPETGRILKVGDITKVEPNVHAGVKHMRSLMNTFFEDAAERIGRETVTYVANILKYYVAYRLVVEETERRAAAKEAVGGARVVSS